VITTYIYYNIIIVFYCTYFIPRMYRNPSGYDCTNHRMKYFITRFERHYYHRVRVSRIKKIHIIKISYYASREPETKSAARKRFELKYIDNFYIFFHPYILLYRYVLQCSGKHRTFCCRYFSSYIT